ncbi:MAG: hypothetical protein WC307_03425 [Candidatus Nanoarchaeia archaeon]|jgi:hypothetical protein
MDLIQKIAKQVYYCNLDEALLIIDDEKALNPNRNILYLYEIIVQSSFYETTVNKSLKQQVIKELDDKPIFEAVFRNVFHDVCISFAEELINLLAIKAPDYSGKEEELTNALSLINHYLTYALKCKPDSERFSKLDLKVNSILSKYKL